MNNNVSNKLFIIILLFSLNMNNSFAEKNNSLNNKLIEIEQDIKNIDNQISKKVKLLNSINNYINKNKQQQTALLTEQQEKQELLDNYKNKLLKQLESTYIINRHNNFNNINNLKDPGQLNRFLNYMKNLNNNNNNNINNIRSTLDNLNNLNNEITLLNKQQIKYKDQVNKSYNNLKELKNNNLQLKAELKSKIKKLSLEQKYNKSNHDQLLNTIPDYQKSLYKQADSIYKSKGKLQLPVSGLINTNYKSLQSHKAIFIQTNEGSKVKSIFNGQVVFSNWLRGFGFLIIVNHGDGYMSLYGQNQTLLKKQGDIVEAGEVIALSGSSGGNDESGLYFEIRHNGAAVNPLAWLKTDLKKKLI